MKSEVPLEQQTQVDPKIDYQIEEPQINSSGLNGPDNSVSQQPDQTGKYQQLTSNIYPLGLSSDFLDWYQTVDLKQALKKAIDKNGFAKKKLDKLTPEDVMEIYELMRAEEKEEREQEIAKKVSQS